MSTSFKPLPAYAYPSLNQQQNGVDNKKQAYAKAPANAPSKEVISMHSAGHQQRVAMQSC